MSRGPGRVQRAVDDFLTNAIRTRDCDFRLTLDDIAKAVYVIDKVTAKHRNAVWRVVGGIKSGPIEGGGGWYVVKLNTWRRAWDFLVPQLRQSQGEPPPPSHPAPRQDGRLAGAFALLSSPVAGERDAALMAAGRLLEARGMTWLDVAAAVDRHAAAAR